MRGKSPSHLRRAAPGLDSSLLHGAPPFQACGGMLARASGQFSFVRRVRRASGAQQRSMPSPARSAPLPAWVENRAPACGAPGSREPSGVVFVWFQTWRPRKWARNRKSPHERASVFAPTAIVRGGRLIQDEHILCWGGYCRKFRLSAHLSVECQKNFTEINYAS